MKFEFQPDRNEMIGAGAFKRVYKEAGSTEVIAVMKHEYSTEQMKGLFYLNKIAQMLFPGKVATVSQSGNFENGDTHQSQFQSKYIEHDEGHAALQGVAKALDGNYHAENDEQQELLSDFFGEMYNTRQSEIFHDERIRDFLDSYAQSGLTDVGEASNLEWGIQDIILHSDDFTYVDIPVPWIEADGEVWKLKFDPVRLQNSINQLAEEERGKAQVYLDRLMELVKEVRPKV